MRLVAELCLPFRSNAVRLIEGLSRHSGEVVDLRQLAARLAGHRLSGSDLDSLTLVLEKQEVLTPVDDGHTVNWSSGALDRLRWVLDGANMATDLTNNVKRPVSVVTLPNSDFVIADTLKQAGVERASLGRTLDAFASIARAAKSIFIVATPFIDSAGIDLFNDLLKAVQSGVSCHLIVRNFEAVAAAEPDSQAGAVHPRAAIHSYDLRTQNGLRETFHAKYFVADTDLAYIGSANLLQASLERTVETGVLLSGPDAKPLCIFARAMLAAATTARASTDR